MGCSLNGAMQGRGMVHHPHGRMCAVEGLHYGTAWRHGTAQRLPEFTSRAARARHEVAIESLTYKFIRLSAVPLLVAAALRCATKRAAESSSVIASNSWVVCTALCFAYSLFLQKKRRGRRK